MLGRFFILFFAYLWLLVIDDIFYEAYYAIFLSSITILLFLRIAIKSKNSLYSPVSIFVNLYNLYVIFGTVMWLYREAFFFNWQGDFFTVIRAYLFTSFTITTWGAIELGKRGALKEPDLCFSQLILHPFVFFILLYIEYLGIYLYTAGFSIIPFFQDEIDQSRFELATVDRPGAGLGVFFLYCGIFCIVHSLWGVKSLFSKILFFTISYFPFLLYGGRLMMIIPLLVCLLLATVKKQISLNKKVMIKVCFSLFFFFFLLMFYGTYRQQGESTDVDLLLNYASADLFPELRGSMASYYENKQDLTLPIISYIISMMLPGGIATAFGIDKGNQLSIGSYVADLLGFEGFGIRTSITGELLLTNGLTYILAWFFLLVGLKKLMICILSQKFGGVQSLFVYLLGYIIAR